jgi:hypothetical protein
MERDRVRFVQCHTTTADGMVSDYADTLIQRDIRDLARISALEALLRLLALAAGQTACLENISELAAPFQMSRPTIREYMTLLSRIFLLEELPPWHGNRMKRLIKTPKLHLGDTGLACTLLGLAAELLWKDRAVFGGRLLETFDLGTICMPFPYPVFGRQTDVLQRRLPGKWTSGISTSEVYFPSKLAIGYLFALKS